MRTVDIKLASMTQQQRKRMDFRLRMTDAEVLEESDSVCVVMVADDQLDHLIDAMLSTVGVRGCAVRKVRA